MFPCHYISEEGSIPCCTLLGKHHRLSHCQSVVLFIDRKILYLVILQLLVCSDSGVSFLLVPTQIEDLYVDKENKVKVLPEQGQPGSSGGKTKTSMVATISPSSLDIKVTLSTLDYASRAKRIANKPEADQRPTELELARDYGLEIDRLQRDLPGSGDKSGVSTDRKDCKQMCKKLDMLAVNKGKEEHLKASERDQTRIRKFGGCEFWRPLSLFFHLSRLISLLARSFLVQSTSLSDRKSRRVLLGQFNSRK